MDDQTLKEAVKKIRESPDRNFTQTIDFIVNLKNLDLKNPDHQVEFFLKLPKPKGKASKVCALVAAELADEAKNVDHVIMEKDFDSFASDKRKTKKLANEYDFFVAQANIMPKVAKALGRVLGPRGKMPNPKAGCVVPPNANLKQLHERLQYTVKVSGKKAPLIQTIVGNEEMKDGDIIENIKYIYSNILHHLPQNENNIKSMYLKTTMGTPVKL